MTNNYSEPTLPEGPIFIVGMNGSGTTMLLDHLNSHSRIYGFIEETRILPYYIENIKKYGDLSQAGNLKRLWLDMCSSFPFWKANNESPIPLPEDWLMRDRSPAQIFDFMMSRFASNAGKAIWCEKSPMYALHIQRLAEALPDARFIHIIRDGRDCAASFQRRWGYRPDVTIYRWKKCIEAARSQAANIDSARYMEVRFEALTWDPKMVLKSICEFLGVEFEDRILVTDRSTERIKGISSKQITRNSGAYKTYFSSAEIMALEKISGSLLCELSYRVDNKVGDEELGKLYIWMHQFIAHLSRIGDIIERSRHAKKPWALICSRLRSGLDYIRTNRY